MEFLALPQVSGKITKGGNVLDANTLKKCKAACNSSDCIGITWTGTTCLAIKASDVWTTAGDPNVQSFLAVPKIKSFRFHTMTLCLVEFVILVVFGWYMLNRKK